MKEQQEESSFSIGGGPQLLLLSLAGACTAAGVSITRWLLSETGEILLLFGGEEEEGHHHYCDAAATGGLHDENILSSFEEIPDIVASCTASSSSSSSSINIIGQSLLSISSSPQIRCIPLFLVFFSSTTFLLGFILTQKQFSKLLSSKSILISNYYHTYMTTCITSMIKLVFGEEIGDEIEVQQQRSFTTMSSLRDLSKWITQRTSHTFLMKMDNLILDEYVRWFIQNGVEMVLGLGGGIVLYSLPETFFSSCSIISDADDYDDTGDDKRKKFSAIVRQRLIHAADPKLERILFSPGGMWELLPSGWRECCLTTTDHPEKKQDGGVVVMSNNEERGQQQQREEMGVKKIKMIDDSLDTTQETLVGTEICATVSVGSTDNETDDDGDDDEFASTRHRAVPPMSSVEMKTTNEGFMTSTENGIRFPRESIGEALYATICDVVASNLANALHSRKSTTSSSSRHEQRQQQQTSTEFPLPPRPPSPQEQIEKFLHHTTIAATTVFLCQFLSSPTTRRSWMSAIKFLTSAGLFSTAITAGAASHLLRSSDATSTASIMLGSNSPITMICSKIIDWIQEVSSSPLYSSISSSVALDIISSKVHVMFHRLREEIKKNKRLQATVALMILYGVKQLPWRRKIRSGGMKSRRLR